MISKRLAPPSGDNKLFHTPPTGACKLFHAPAEGICKTHPRRAGVQIIASKGLAPPEVITNSPPPADVQIMITKKTCPAAGDNKLFHTPPTGTRTHPSTAQNPPANPISRHPRICVRMRAGAARHPGPRTQATPAENSSPNCEYSLKFTVLLLTNKRSCGTI